MPEPLPLVSICCTTYNQETYIRDAIEGFLMQKTTFPIEIIIHDDASTDNTATIVKDYTDRFPKLIFPIFQKENQYSKGIKPAAAYSWPKARGKYIALCEGDDYWTDNLKLQKQADLLEANETVSFCFHNAQIYNCITGECRPYNFRVPNGIYTTREFLRNKRFVPTASILFRKSCLPNPIPAWYHRVYAADYALELLLSTKGNTYYLNTKMSLYRLFAINSFSLNRPRIIVLLKNQISLIISFNLDQNMKYSCLSGLLIIKMIVKYSYWGMSTFIQRRFPFSLILKRILLNLIR